MNKRAEFVDATCVGKHRFESHTMASKVRSHAKNARGTYRCKVCGGWHIGSSKPKSGRDKNPRQGP